MTSSRMDAEDRLSVVSAPSCSATGCRRPAEWGLRWNNPKLHPPERRKTWMACGEHRSTLEEFLSARGFWRETLTLEELQRT